MQAAWRVLEGTLKAEPADPATRSTGQAAGGKCCASRSLTALTPSMAPASNSPAEKPRLHLYTNGLPLRFVDFRGEAAIGDELDRPLGEQHVQQDAGVARGVPHSQFAEHFRAPARARRRRPAAGRRTAAASTTKRISPPWRLSPRRRPPDGAFRGRCRPGAAPREQVRGRRRQQHHQRPEAPPPPVSPPPPLKLPPPPPPPPNCRRRSRHPPPPQTPLAPPRRRRSGRSHAEHARCRGRATTRLAVGNQPRHCGGGADQDCARRAQQAAEERRAHEHDE